MSAGPTARGIDALPDGVVVADADGRVSDINTRAADLLGVAVDDMEGELLDNVLAVQNLEGKDWVSCVRPYDGLAIRRRVVESSWFTASGRELLVTAAIHRDRPAGKVTSCAIGIRDARSRERADRERSDLVATVAHELRSPLTGVKGFTATLLLRWGQLSDSQKVLMLKTVDADADRLTRLIAELLDVARIHTGRLSIRPEPVDLVDAVQAQLESLSGTGQRRITLQADARPTVWVDRDKLAQVMANLVENAIRHGDGDIEVTVSDLEDGGAEIVVDDEGDGIPVEIRPRIFTKFWKHGKAGGSGLGLYIVGGLIDAHGGQVLVEDSPSGGARMRVNLPSGRPETLDD
ncbi:MAG: ATP-binding protein [Nocardioidaceae bacterium]